MNINAFLTCLGVFGVATGASASLEGVYSPLSGTTGYLYNQIYPTSFHTLSGLLYAPAVPLINVYNANPTGTLLSGNNGYSAGYQHNGNFAVIMDIEYSGDSRSLQGVGKSNVLLSTVDNLSGLSSGFAILINDANRLYFKTLNKSYTLSTELGTRDIVYVALTENQYVSLGIFKMADNQIYTKNILLDSGSLNSNSLYFGNFLNNTNSLYTGFSGKLNQVLLFNDDLSNSDIMTCSTCSYVTGVTTSPNITSFSGFQITGLTFSGFQIPGTIINANLIGQVFKHDGSIINVIYNSIQTGSITSGEVATPLLGNVIIQTSGNNFSFVYDNNALNCFVTASILFDIGLTSGDIVEYYTYPAYNTGIGKPIINATWPLDTGIIQLIGNGLNETNGVDYIVDRQVISGFNVDDVLSYDILTNPTVVTRYSGYWQNERIPMSGGGFYPLASQYLENTGLSQVLITGLNTVCTGNPFYPMFGYDLFLNGQKMVSGLQYSISASGSGFLIGLSGANLPLINANLLYSPTGGLPTGVASVDVNELTFTPQFSGFQRTQVNITGNVSVISNVVGFSEQVWINGVRQFRNQDYFLIRPGSYITGNSDAPNTVFTTYYSESDNIGLWNFTIPPNVDNNLWNAQFTSGQWNTFFGLTAPNGYRIGSGDKFLEIQYRNYPNFIWKYMGQFSVTDGENGVLNADVGQQDGSNFFHFKMRGRYHNNNMIGQWLESVDFTH